MTAGVEPGLPRTLGDVPAHAAHHWPGNRALYFEGRAWTYAELGDAVDRAALGLIAAGVRTGDRVALWITNRPEYLVAFFAVLRVGAVAVPLNTRWRTRDLVFALRHSRASLLVSETVSGPVDFAAMVRGALAEGCPALRSVVLLEAHQLPGAVAWEDMLAAHTTASRAELLQRADAVNPDGMALLMYTSGTTGMPKGVMLSHRGIGPSLERARALGLSPQSVQLNYLPIFHIYAKIFAVLPTMLVGATQVLMNRFDAVEALRLVASQRVTVLHGFDTHYRELLAALAMPGAHWDISSLQWGTFSAGAGTARGVALQVQQSLCRTISCFGQSETWGAVTAGQVGCTLDQSCAASGAPLPGVAIRIVDPVTGVDVEAGATGEILVRCDSVMLGYDGAETETRAVLDAGGWVHTGDAGCLRPDGHLRFLGRYKDMLKVGGENVDPAEVEALLLESPLVRQVAVVGCADARLGEVAAAFVVPAAGADPEEVRRQVDTLCKGRIASFKIPRRIECVVELPVNAAGKVDKKLLRQQLKERPA